MLAEVYKNTLYSYQPDIEVTRWWVPGYPLIIGGSIIDAADFEHLRKEFGVAYVINVETEHDDVGKVPHDLLCQPRVEDSGSPFSREAVLSAISFVRENKHRGVCYLHCQMGGSRSPGFGYAVLRGVFKLSPDEALAKINEGFRARQNQKRKENELPYGHHPFHQRYMASVEEALLCPQPDSNRHGPA